MKISKHIPQNVGWLDVQLDDKHIDHLWNCIKARGGSFKNALVGQIEKSYKIFDKDDIFWKEVILPCVNEYGNHFSHKWSKNPITPDINLEPYLETMWVNYQNAGEYQPIHDHSGLYSFAIWLTNPVEYSDQSIKKNAVGAKSSFNNTFCFQHLNMLGQQSTTMYPMNKELEGWMVFFPSQLNHFVYPYYDCDEQRVSISGNVMLKDDKTPIIVVD